MTLRLANSLNWLADGQKIYELTSSEFWSSHRQTDRQTDRQKAMHMSPPCISTGVLNNIMITMSKYLLETVYIRAALHWVWTNQ